MTGFELYPDAIIKVLNDTPAVEVLRNLADKAVADARSTGPRARHGGPHTIDLITVGETHITPAGAVVDIDWPSSVWHLIEFGSVNNPPYRPVTRAAQNLGLSVGRPSR